MQESDVVLLEQIIQAIVAKPDDKDAGALIGRGGETIAAIRRIMKLVGVKSNARINIKLDVPRRSKNDYEKPSIKDQSNNSREL